MTAQREALPNPDQVLVTVAESARLYRVSRPTIYNLIYSGALPTVQIGRARRIRLSALHEWAAQAERSPAPLPLPPGNRSRWTKKQPPKYRVKRVRRAGS